ncbi:nucleotidyltransferase family protein [Desertibaculum subflavum]|uniref:nucleotidyltransferase family protein n=1 Tax=Desertibaculum subflavum TaxID=2268458 RepID=UPI000E6762BA
MSLAGVDVAVLAGGLGTRIAGVLGDTPKVLAPVDGRPYLAWLVDWLARFGVRRVVLCLGHLASKVEDWVARNPRADMEIVVSVEPSPLGTAGALRHARAQLGSDPVLVLNGDSFVAADLAALLARHRAAGTEATMLCVQVADAGRYGRIELDEAGRIRRFAEKEAGGGPGLINAGFYLLGRAMLDRIAAGQATSIEQEIFMAEAPGRIAAEVTGGPFIDIGTPESLAAAGAAFRRIVGVPA